MKRLFALAVCTAAVATTFAAQENKPAVRRAQKPIHSQYIVVLRPDIDPEGMGNEAAARFSGRLRHVYESALRGFAVALPAPAAAILAEDPRVLYIEEDAEIALAQFQSSPPWGLDRIDQRTLPLDLSYLYGSAMAQQVTVHVLDTGVRTSHFEFAGRAFVAADYVDDDRDGDPSDIANDDADPSRPDGQDCHGHGTHVAGTIAGLTVGVAKYAVVQSHRVLACDGSGTLSGLIAAIDAVTEDPARPAVANMSLGGGISTALDAAVQTSIAAGVTYVIAAGNSNVDASTTSPARVPQAITVGATTSTDARASFSNYGPLLDLFAPGASIRSAAHSSDSGMATMSGTSMAAPHAAGVAALYLERHPTATPTDVRNALVAAATPGRVTSPGTGSPNLLLYSGFLHASAAEVTLISPNGGEKLFTAMPFQIRWDVPAGADSVSRFDLMASTNDGAAYAAIPGCSNLPATARMCTWATPGPATSKARVRVIATGSAGETAFDTSAAVFTIATGAATITVTAPNSALNWGRTSMQQIKWSHNLGANSYVRIELSRDGGLTFTETIADGVKNIASSSGVYDWRVTGPNTPSAVVRVSWTAGPAADVSNVGFIIADPFITVSSPSSSATAWGYETLQRISWATNLGPLDKVSVLLSADGATFVPLATGVTASARRSDVRLPVLAAPTVSARIRVTWTNGPDGVTVAGTNPAGFKLQPAYVTVTTPNGGEVWATGVSQTLRWVSNLGSLEFVDVQLSIDGGATWTTILARTKNDHVHSVVFDGASVTTTGRIRVIWSDRATVADTSNANFTVR